MFSLYGLCRFIFSFIIIFVAVLLCPVYFEFCVVVVVMFVCPFIRWSKFHGKHCAYSMTLLFGSNVYCLRLCVSDQTNWKKMRERESSQNMKRKRGKEHRQQHKSPTIIRNVCMLLCRYLFKWNNKFNGTDTMVKKCGIANRSHSVILRHSSILITRK